jgi:hypothetical protein
MSETEMIEQQIRELLATETRAIPFSNRLFSPQGLFNRLAQTEEQRRAVAQSSLFQQAQARFLELQRQEAAEFSRALQQVRTATLGDNFFIKLENTERD